MTTQICINVPAGEDCLEFSRVGSGATSRWQLDQVKSKVNSKIETESQSTRSSNTGSNGLFYVNQTAYGNMV